MTMPDGLPQPLSDEPTSTFDTDDAVELPEEHAEDGGEPTPTPRQEIEKLLE